MNPIDFQTKTDRELLLVAVEKINTIDEKLDFVCVNVEVHDKEIENLNLKTSMAEEFDKNNRKIIVGIIVGIITVVTGIVTAMLKHLGLT